VRLAMWISRGRKDNRRRSFGSLSRRAEVGKYQAFHLFAVDNSPRPHLPITSLLHTA
jgi:hypothetical protein